MPCFSCVCFKENVDRWGKRINGGRGYCERWDEIYWRGHECGQYAPTWYAPKTTESSLKEPQNIGFFNIFKRNKRKSISLSNVIDEISDESYEDDFDTDEIDGFYDTYEEDETDEFLEDDYEEDLYEEDCDDEETELISSNVISTPNKRLKTVRRNITVDDKVFKKYGLFFKCHLVEHCDTLQLNFKIDSKNANLSKFPRYNELTIKANAYDKKGNLISIEETGFDYSALKSGYISEFFYFSDVSMVDAHSLRVYAVDPANDEDDFLTNEAEVAGYYIILNDALKSLENTLYPRTYFEKYDSALYNAKQIAETTQVESHRVFALEIIRDLTENRTQKIKSFIDRCYSNGTLYSAKEDYLNGKYDIPSELMNYIESLLNM